MKLSVDGRVLIVQSAFPPPLRPGGKRLSIVDLLSLEHQAEGVVTRQALSRGMALCSEADEFVKEKGRRIALARALRVAGFSRAQRAQVWAAYREARGGW